MLSEAAADALSDDSVQSLSIEESESISSSGIESDGVSDSIAQPRADFTPNYSPVQLCRKYGFILPFLLSFILFPFVSLYFCVCCLIVCLFA
jgi:hypothetical protein